MVVVIFIVLKEVSMNVCVQSNNLEYALMLHRVWSRIHSADEQVGLSFGDVVCWVVFALCW